MKGNVPDKLTYELRMMLRQAVGTGMRRRYWREKRMNLYGEDRPIDKKSERFKS